MCVKCSQPAGSVHRPLAATQMLKFDIVLAMRDQAARELLKELYNPSSPFYQHYLTPQDFTARFGPSQENYNALINSRWPTGFTVAGGSRDSMTFNSRLPWPASSRFQRKHECLPAPHGDRNGSLAVDREPSVDLPFSSAHQPDWTTIRSAIRPVKEVGCEVNATTAPAPRHLSAAAICARLTTKEPLSPAPAEHRFARVCEALISLT